jgi:hypothetical protein
MSTNREKWTKNSMNRRSLLKGAVALGLAACAGEGMAEEQQDKVKAAPAPAKPEPAGDSYEEPAKRLPARRFDVVVAGGGTAGVMAAIAAARQGAKTVLIESKGYTGGIITEGGTALHSFFNVWKPYGSFGIPYRALCAAEIENLLVAGMMITSAFVAHHSTRNTVSCMAQGQAVGTAAALCAAKTCMTRDLKYPELKKALLDGGVYLKS